MPMATFLFGGSAEAEACMCEGVGGFRQARTGLLELLPEEAADDGHGEGDEHLGRKERGGGLVGVVMAWMDPDRSYGSATSINQSINQSIHRFINQSTHQLINVSIRDSLGADTPTLPGRGGRTGDWPWSRTRAAAAGAAL